LHDRLKRVSPLSEATFRFFSSFDDLGIVLLLFAVLGLKIPHLDLSCIVLERAEIPDVHNNATEI
jgi:hypothetical protein